MEVVSWALEIRVVSVVRFRSSRDVSWMQLADDGFDRSERLSGR
jgi:hypothetical protein